MAIQIVTIGKTIVARKENNNFFLIVSFTTTPFNIYSCAKK